MLNFILNLKLMASTKITVNDNGSLRIEGDFEIVDKIKKVSIVYIFVCTFVSTNTKKDTP